MKTIHKLFLIATIALGLGFVACNDADDISPVDESKANTHVSVALKLSSNNGAGTRALPNDYNYVGEWAGKDVIKTVSIYLVDPASTGPVTRRTFDVGSQTEGKPYYTTDLTDGTLNIIPREAAAIKTTAGKKDVWVVINENQAVQKHLATATATDFESKYQTIALVLENSGYDFSPTPATSAAKLAKVEEVSGEDYDVIVMTNVKPVLELEVAANVSAEQTVGTGTPPNRASLEVERAVARVLVTLKEGFTQDLKDANGATIGTISNVNWVLAQGENSLYVQRKENWATPNFTWLPAADENYWSEAGAKYDYSGLYEGWKAAPLFGGNALTGNPSNGNKDDENAGNIGAASIGKGRFILPTTHKYGVKDASDYKKGNTAYVLVRAQFFPSNAAYADGTTDYEVGDDFYVGANGKFYSSASNAINPTTGGVKGQTVAKYVGGKVLYYAWVNPDHLSEGNEGNWYNSPVLRNNIYHINITGFKNIGTNWNPLFPEDPNVPPFIPNEGYDPKVPTEGAENPPYIPNDDFDPEKPIGPDNPTSIPNPEYDPEQPTTPGTNPPYIPNEEYEPSKNPDPKPWVPGVDEPTNPIDPEEPLTTPETWMSVDVTVLPWKVHSYGVDLGI